MRTTEQPIYLDYAATTPVDPRVAEVMSGYLTAEGVFGNPASAHAAGRAAAAAVERARRQVAALIGADPREIVWTSGATEADNLAIKGAAEFYRDRGRHIVTARTEHRAVLDPCASLEARGWRITRLEPGEGGIVTPEQVRAALTDETVLVSLMHVNNEIGVVQDIGAIGAVCREGGARLHVDAAQSAGRLRLDMAWMPVDYLSLSAHKLYGPKGIGALYVRRRPRARLAARIHGGGHERGLRAGTLATHQIVGMGRAFQIAAAEGEAEVRRLRGLRQRLWERLQAAEPVFLNGDPQRRVPAILNVSFPGVHGEALLTEVSRAVAAASGAACSSASREPSYVLRALGRDETLAEASLRLSLGRFTTGAEVDAAADAVVAAVDRLRSLSPLWPETGASTSVAGRFDDGGETSWLSHFLRPRNAGAFPESEESVARALVGDERQGAAVEIALRLDADGTILESRFRAWGGVATIAAASLATEWLRGRGVAEAGDVRGLDLAAALGLEAQQTGEALRVEDAVQVALERSWRPLSGISG